MPIWPHPKHIKEFLSANLTQLRPIAVKLRILVFSFRSYFLLERHKPVAYREDYGTPEKATDFIGEARKTRPRDVI